MSNKDGSGCYPLPHYRCPAHRLPPQLRDNLLIDEEGVEEGGEEEGEDDCEEGEDKESHWSKTKKCPKEEGDEGRKEKVETIWDTSYSDFE